MGGAEAFSVVNTEISDVGRVPGRQYAVVPGATGSALPNLASLYLASVYILCVLQRPPQCHQNLK